jgi:putative N-acetyltransferase (TIGR04045 family)
MMQTALPSFAAATEDHSARRFIIKLAENADDLHGYAELRREVFCVEQKLFAESDRDEHDASARPIVAIGVEADGTESVVGTVRIFETELGTWYGSRLAVASNWRGVPGLSAGLIRMAVCTAHTLGCQKFLANVQRQNVPLFRRLHWKSIGMIDVCGLPHHLMQADLEHYPPQASS